MLRLKRMNVVKEVDSMTKAKKLIAEGFVLVSQPVFVNAVTTMPKLETSEPARVDCPHCDKNYSSEKNLKEHIKKIHPETLKK